jgi:predicted amidohydrolase
MKIAIIQIHSIPDEVDHNFRQGINMYINAVEKSADIVVFPELWTCGYYLETLQFEKAVEKNPKIIEKFQQLAIENHTIIILPLPRKENNRLYIGLLVIEQNGELINEYHKSFLWGREQNYFVHGDRAYDPVDTSMGKIGVLICYDIEFPEPSRILALKGADIIIVPSVWSIPAKNRWEIQLPARALDNTVFIVGVNTVGEGACGSSQVVDPIGNVLAKASPDKEEVLLCDINLERIREVRQTIPYLDEYDLDLYPGKYDKPLS